VRRLFSISAIVALLTSLVPAHVLMICHVSSQRRICHRAAGTVNHECGMMHEQESSSQDDSSSQIVAADLQSKCPMNCCFQFNSSTGALAVVHDGHPQRMVIEYNLQPALVVFAANGFSSHTDRGPPLV
jgi:hypothetical protein